LRSSFRTYQDFLGYVTHGCRKLTEQLLEGKQPHIPWAAPDTFKKAARESSGANQDELPF